MRTEEKRPHELNVRPTVRRLLLGRIDGAMRSEEERKGETMELSRLVGFQSMGAGDSSMARFDG